jgi:hypothetical protein
MIDIEKQLAKAVKHFWKTREAQKVRQGSSSGKKDAGNRSAVTGGKHADGFVQLIAAIVKDAGLATANIHVAQKLPRTLPGYFPSSLRPTKKIELHPFQVDEAFQLLSYVGRYETVRDSCRPRAGRRTPGAVRRGIEIGQRGRVAAFESGRIAGGVELIRRKGREGRKGWHGRLIRLFPGW